MRKFLISILFIPIICFGQTKQDLFYLIDKFPKDKSGMVDFYIVDSLKNTNKEVLHARAIQAIEYFFKDSPSPLIPAYNDNENTITYKGRFGRYERAKKGFTTTLNTYIYRFSLKIEYRDNWCRIDIYDISECIENNMTDLADLLNKEYYNKTKLSASSLKLKYNSIYFIYNYISTKIKSINEYMKQAGKSSNK